MRRDKYGSPELVSWDVLTGDGAGNILRGCRGGRYPRGRIKDNAEDAEKSAGLKDQRYMEEVSEK